MWDGEAIAKLQQKYPDFFSDPNNLVLTLTADGFLAFGKRGAKVDKKKENGKSIWHITMTINNLPPDIRTKLGASAPLGFTPMAHFQDIQPFLEPMMNELLLLWHGVDMYNAQLARVVRVRGMLFHIVGDYPALAKLLGRQQQPTPFACFYCKIQGVKAWTGKTLYGGFWRCLPLDSAGRALGRLYNYSPLRNSTTTSVPRAWHAKPERASTC